MSLLASVMLLLLLLLLRTQGLRIRWMLQYSSRKTIRRSSMISTSSASLAGFPDLLIQVHITLKVAMTSYLCPSRGLGPMKMNQSNDKRINLSNTEHADPRMKMGDEVRLKVMKGAIDSSTLKPNWSRGVYKISKVKAPARHSDDRKRRRAATYI